MAGRSKKPVEWEGLKEDELSTIFFELCTFEKRTEIFNDKTDLLNGYLNLINTILEYRRKFEYFEISIFNWIFNKFSHIEGINKSSISEFLNFNLKPKRENRKLWFKICYSLISSLLLGSPPKETSVSETATRIFNFYELNKLNNYETPSFFKKPRRYFTFFDAYSDFAYLFKYVTLLCIKNPDITVEVYIVAFGDSWIIINKTIRSFLENIKNIPNLFLNLAVPNSIKNDLIIKLPVDRPVGGPIDIIFKRGFSANCKIKMFEFSESLSNIPLPSFFYFSQIEKAFAFFRKKTCPNILLLPRDEITVIKNLFSNPNLIEYDPLNPSQ